MVEQGPSTAFGKRCRLQSLQSYDFYLCMDYYFRLTDHNFFYFIGKRPASLVLPSAPRRPTRGGHQSGWATMPAGSRARQQNRQVRYDLHLPSMPALTCKTSSQALLLRVLKVILQLREAARKTASGTTSARTRSAQRRGEFALFYSRKFGLEIKD